MKYKVIASIFAVILIAGIAGCADEETPDDIPEDLLEAEAEAEEIETNLREINGEFYDADFYDELSDAIIVDISDYSEEFYEESDTLIVEKIIGVVLDDDGNGEIINENGGYYISYSNVDGVEPGNVVTTYIIHAPDEGFDGGVRYDFIVDSREFE